MSKNAKSIKDQLRTIGRFPKFFALFGASSLVLPIFSYAATAATVNPSGVLAPNLQVQVLNDARNARVVRGFVVSPASLVSKLGRNGAVRISTHYSALLYSNKSHRGVTAVATSSSTSTTVVAPTPTTTVAPTTTTTTSSARTSSAPTSTATTSPATIAAPATTTTVAPVTTTTAAPAPTTTVAPAPTTTTTAAPAPTTTTTVAPATTTSGAPQPVNGVAGSWKMVFDSEFNGSSLDPSQWSAGWYGSGITPGVNSIEQDCMDPSLVNVSGGVLTLSAIAKQETCGGVTQPYASSIVTTNGKFSFTYGFMEAKIWMPGNGSISDWPAFWAVGQNWPTNGEIDVVEGLGGSAQVHFHYAGGTLGPLTGTGTYTGGWHTFGADWEPGSITFYYDGVDIGSFTNGITSAPMNLILDMAVSSESPAVAPAAMKVDYVRVWQH